MLSFLYKPSHKRMVERELDESNRFLLQAQTNMEHWQSQVSYHQTKIKRLTHTWKTLNAEEAKNDGPK